MALNYKMIGKNIKTRRKELHVTQQQMADDLYISLSLVSKLERGVKAVSMETFHSIAEYLHSSIALLMADPNDPIVQHNQLIREIDSMLEDLDNNHLRVIHQLMKTYKTQTAELLQPADASAETDSQKTG